MSAHSLFSPSKSQMWINCPGSMAFPENQVDGGSSTFADEGTASHYWAGICLETGRDADFYAGVDIEINGAIYTMDEERADFVQLYIDDVRRRAIGGLLFVEYKVDLSHLLGPTQGGTCDAGIINGTNLIVEDLKYGTGEKVYASYDGQINPQLGLYLLGLLRDAQLLGHEIETVTGVICQPRLGHIDEYTCSVKELEAFGLTAKNAVTYANTAMLSQVVDPEDFLHPGEKTCRWCRAKSKCPALAQFVKDTVKGDFEDIDYPSVPAGTNLAIAYRAVPLIEQWCAAVSAEVVKQVTEGKEVLGPDGKPYKFVEGIQGSRKWLDEKAVEAALVGQLGPKAYTEPKLLTAPAAGKLLDKKATKQLWKDLFEPLIARGRGKAQLVVGSDPRPAYNNVATASDFEEDLAE